MTQEIVVPELGESISEGTLVDWLKGDGDTVQEGEPIFELETDKATLAIPSPAAGQLKIDIGAGTAVKVGQVVAWIKPMEAGVSSSEDSAEQPSVDTGPSPKPLESPIPSQDRSERDLSHTFSPAVKRLIEEHQLDPKTIEGTGKGGRILKGDVLAVISKRATQHSYERSIPSAGGREETVPPVSPKRDTPQMAESQPNVVQDVPKRSPRSQVREKMTTMRKRIAERLVRSQNEAAYLTTFNEINMSRVMAIRKRMKMVFEERHGVRLGLMAFFVKAVCMALIKFPQVNAMIDGDEIVYNYYYDIGVAVSVERGLVVPVLRDADKMGFAKIESAIREFAVKAVEKRLTLDELTGGTFTISNGGTFGSLMSTPIPNPPQPAILGMHAIQDRPVVINGEIKVQPMMYVALSYDHRLLDGRDSVAFLKTIKESIEDPERMMLEC